MVSDEQVITSDRWNRRFPKGFAATPVVQWTMRARDSAGATGVYVWRGGGRALAPVSTRKLAASLWRLVATSDGSGSVTWRYGPFDQSIPKFATEEGTKWDFWYSNDALDDVDNLRRHARHGAVRKTKTRMNELIAEAGLRRRINYCIKKLNEEWALQRRTYHQNMCLVIKNLPNDIKRERRKFTKLDMVNSKLLSDIAGAKLSAWKLLQNLGKEKKATVQLENECDELAKCSEGSRAEIGALRNWHVTIQEKINEERKMLQMAEVWKEEHAQMKLVDAKLILEDKHAKINNLIVDCEAIMRPSNLTTHVNLMSEAKGRRVAGYDFSHDQGHYTSSLHHNNSHQVVGEDAPRKSVHSNRLTSGYGSEDTRSGKETVTQADINSIQTPDDSGEGLRNKIRSRINMSNCGAECRKKALGGSQRLQSNEISSVTFVQSENISSSVCKPRNEETCNTILIGGNERLSNRSISSTKHWLSPQRTSAKGEYDYHNLVCRRGSTDRRSPRVVSSKKGHIISPRGIQRHSSAAHLLKPKLVSPKMLIRDILEQRS